MPKKILLITSSNIGDVVLTTPVLQKILDRQDSPRVSVMVGPKAAELFQSDPQIHEVIVYDKRMPWKGKWVLARELRRDGYDEVVDLRRTLFPCALLGWRGLQSLFPRGQKFAHQARRHLGQAFGADRAGSHVRFHICIPDDASRRAQELLSSIGREDFVVIAPGAASDLKRWPLEKFAQIIARMRRAGMTPIVLVGDREQQSLGKMLEEKAPGAILNLIGRTTLLELAAVCKRSALVLSNDSGPMHLAAAVGADVIGIFGPSDAGRYGPFGNQNTAVRLDLSCSPCGKAQCPLGTHACMHDLEVEVVWSEVLRSLRGGIADREISLSSEIITPAKDAVAGSR